MEEKNKKILYLIFYSFLFIFLGYSVISNKDLIDKSIKKNITDKVNVEIVNNYKFKHDIVIGDETITLEGKTFNSKTLTTKETKGTITTYYNDGKKSYKKDNEKFVEYKGNIIDNIDFRLLDFDYLSKLLESPEIESKSDYKLIVKNNVEDVRITLIYDMNKDFDKLIIEKDNYKITSKYYDTDLVKDFDPLKS